MTNLKQAEIKANRAWELSWKKKNILKVRRIFISPKYRSLLMILITILAPKLFPNKREHICNCTWLIFIQATATYFPRDQSKFPFHPCDLIFLKSLISILSESPPPHPLPKTKLHIPLRPSGESCSDLAELFSITSFEQHILYFDFLSRTVKKLLTILCIYYLKFFKQRNVQKNVSYKCLRLQPYVSRAHFR